MESPPLQLDVGQDHEDDRISALPDHLLFDILERLELREAVHAGASSTRWRHLPHQLSFLHLDFRDFHGATPRGIMDAFTGAVQRLLAGCDCMSNRAIKTLILTFCVSAPHLSSIGRAVEDVVSRGQTEDFEFDIHTRLYCRTVLFTNGGSGQHFMSFSRAYPVAFQWLTKLTLRELTFEHSDVADLISACDRLERLDLINCEMAEHSALMIDTPRSGLQVLEFIAFGCTQIELVSVPKLRKVVCESWPSENPPVRFGYVPELRDVSLESPAMAWQEPFALSECLSRSARNLSALCLNFSCQMIWIQPELPKKLTAIFSNLINVELFNIFPECDLSWTLFILEAAPALQNFSLSRDRHSCEETFEDSAEKTNVVWEPSKDLKHVNLKLLLMIGFEEEDKVTDYARLVMERAVCLKKIELCGRSSCGGCDAIGPGSPRRSQMDEASGHRIKERLRHGSSSSVEIIIC